jgi:hypothetical protein
MVAILAEIGRLAAPKGGLTGRGQDFGRRYGR